MRYNGKVQRCLQICRKLFSTLSGPILLKSFGASKHYVVACAETFGQVWIVEFFGKLSTNLNLAVPALHFFLMIRRISVDVGPYTDFISFVPFGRAQRVTTIYFVSTLIVVIHTVLIRSIQHGMSII